MSACLWKSQYLYKIAFGIWLMPGNTSSRNDDVCRLCCTQRKGNERQRERERERERERTQRERERVRGMERQADTQNNVPSDRHT